MALVDRSGKLVRFTIRPGNASENLELDPLIEGIPTGELIADKAYDSNKIRTKLLSAGVNPVIPSQSRRKVQHWYDVDRYAERHLVENYFAKIKQFRRIATQYDKTAACFAGMVSLAALYWETKGSRTHVSAQPSKRQPVLGQLSFATLIITSPSITAMNTHID